MERLEQLLAQLPKLVDSLVYVAIALITLAGLLKCILPVVRTVSALKRAVRRLDKHAKAPQENPVWKDPRFLGRRLQKSWQRYLFNAEQLTFRGLSLNLDDFINDDSVVHVPGNGPFAELIPGLLTSLGILGTFIGLMNGLTGLDFTNTESLMGAIPRLLEGMQYAFATSVAGIACSLFFNIVYRITIGSAFKAMDAFSDAFTQLALGRAPEDTVQLLCQNQDRNVLLHNVAEDVGVNIEDAITRAMTPVTASMDRFIAGATREQMDGIGRIVTHFIIKMNESLSGQFLSLGRTMTELNQNQVLSNETLRTSLATATHTIDDLRTLHLNSHEVLDRFEGYIQKLSARDEKEQAFEEKSAELMERMHQSQEQQARYIASLNEYQSKLETDLRDYMSYSDSILDGLKQKGDGGAARLDAASDRFKETSELLSQSYSSFVENITEGLSRSLAMFEENMHDMLTLLSNNLDRLAGMPRENGQVEAYAQMQRTLSDIRDVLKKDKPVSVSEGG